MNKTSTLTGAEVHGRSHDRTDAMLMFVEEWKDLLFGYLYHRTGSIESATKIFEEVITESVAHTATFWWFKKPRMTSLLSLADRAIEDEELATADLDSVFIPALTWLNATQKKEIQTLHDALWSLPIRDQQCIVFSVLMGLSAERMSSVLGQGAADLAESISGAKAKLMKRWGTENSELLSEIMFSPAIDTTTMNRVRKIIVEKSSALAIRTYQWVFIAGIFAVLSNVIVASVLAFAVVIEPPTSLKSTKMQVASLDALLLEREARMTNIGAIGERLSEHSQKIAGYSVARDLTQLGLSTAKDALEKEQKMERQADVVIGILRRASTALHHLLTFIDAHF